MGDAGSLFIGMVLACVGILSLFKVVTATFVVVPLLMFGLPLYDTLSVMLGRAMHGKPLFQADKTHIHHRLLSLGWHQKKAVLFLYSVCLLLSFMAIDLTINKSRSILLLGMGLLLVIFLRVYRLWRAKLREEAAKKQSKS
jgi:UDP-GlcNAc:undecaprenyl-phosphate GlcNAc-1-phosphate transferase